MDSERYDAKFGQVFRGKSSPVLTMVICERPDGSYRCINLGDEDSPTSVLAGDMDTWGLYKAAWGQVDAEVR